MKRTIQLRESDIHRMVMEAVRRMNESVMGDEDYPIASQEEEDDMYEYPGLEVDPEVKKRQTDMALDMIDTAYKPDLTKDRFMDNPFANTSLLFSNNDGTMARNYKYNDLDAPYSLVKVTDIDSLRSADRRIWDKGCNNFGTKAQYYLDTKNLEESINRAVKRTIRRMNESVMGDENYPVLDQEEEEKDGMYEYPRLKVDPEENDLYMNIDWESIVKHTMA